MSEGYFCLVPEEEMGFSTCVKKFCSLEEWQWFQGVCRIATLNYTGIMRS